MTYIIDKHHNLWKKMNMKMAIQSPIRIKTLNIILAHNQKMKFNSNFSLRFLIKQIPRVPQLQDYSFPYQFTIFYCSSDKATLIQTFTYRLLSSPLPSSFRPHHEYPRGHTWRVPYFIPHVTSSHLTWPLLRHWYPYKYCLSLIDNSSHLHTESKSRSTVKNELLL